MTGQRQTVNCAPAKKHETLPPVPFLMCAHLTTSLAAGSHVFLYQLHCPCTRLPGWSSSWAPAWCSWSLRPQVWPQNHWHVCRASAARPGLGLLKVLSELLSPPSGLALLADSVSLSGAALAGSALPQSTSSCWPSLSAAWVAVAVASFAVGCGVSPASATASALPPSSGPTSSSARVGMAVAPLAVGCGVFLAASVLPPRCCLAFAFVFVLGFRVFPAWLLVVGLPVLAFIFRRMRRAFARRPLISCGNRII